MSAALEGRIRDCFLTRYMENATQSANMGVLHWSGMHLLAALALCMASSCLTSAACRARGGSCGGLAQDSHSRDEADLSRCVSLHERALELRASGNHLRVCASSVVAATLVVSRRAHSLIILCSRAGWFLTDQDCSRLSSALSANPMLVVDCPIPAGAFCAVRGVQQCGLQCRCRSAEIVVFRRFSRLEHEEPGEPCIR